MQHSVGVRSTARDVVEGSAHVLPHVLGGTEPASRRRPLAEGTP